jgi:tetratricopeptide (TPR) repeat protein
VAAQPADWKALQQRGNANVQLRRWEEAIGDYSEAIELAPKVMQLYRDRAIPNLEAANWQAAIDDLSRIVESKRIDWRDYYHLALAQLGADKTEAYRETCRKMVIALAGSQDPQAMNFAAWTCCLAPGALDDWNPAIDLARRAVAAQPESLQLQNTLGTILSRAGQHDEAIRILSDVAEKLPAADASSTIEPAYTWFALARAQAAAGHVDEAKSWLDKAFAAAETSLLQTKSATEPLAWNRRLSLELMAAENDRPAAQ